ncbi:tail fiber domain-containing protein [Bdellovibrio sp. NC01]|nr:tail fiber domain-containing protein [Bdellovibrio sp. NC01]
MVSYAFASPTTLTYQGRILGSDGSPLEYNDVSFLFEIKSEDGLCVYYREQKNGVNMTNSKGVFDVPLGTGTQLFPTSGSVGLKDIFDNTKTLDCADANNNVASSKGPVVNQSRRLTVKFHDGIGWNLISPDNEIRSVPYSLFAATAAKLGSYSATDFVRTNILPATACSAGQVVFFNGSSFTCVTDAGGTGVIADVVAGTGINVTGTTTKTVSANFGTTAGTIAQGNDSRITGAFQSSTALGGDLTGTLPNPTVAKVQGVAVATTAPQTGQVYRFSGTELEPIYFGVDDLKTSTGLSQFSSACTSSQTLTWSAVTDAFTCTNIAGLDAAAIATGTIPAARLPSSVVLPEIAAPSVSGTNEGTIYFDSTAKKFKVSQSGSAYVDLIGGVTYPLLGSSGTASAPTYSFTSTPSTGMYSPNNNQIAFATGGTQRLRIQDNSIYLGSMGSGNSTPGEFRFDSRYYGPTSSWGTGRFTVSVSQNQTAAGSISMPAMGVDNTISGSYTQGGEQGAVSGIGTVTNTAGFTGTSYGVMGRVNPGIGAANITGLQTALWGRIEINGQAGLPTSDKMNAVTAQVSLVGVAAGGSTITEANAIEIKASTTAYDSITTYTGIRLRAPTGAGTITTKYAFTTEPNSGNVGIETTTPQYTLDVNGSFRSTSNASSWSDIRAKKNIEEIPEALKKVSQLRGVTFDWRTEEFPDQKFKTTRDMGVIAQEVEKVFPEAVQTANDGYKSVSYSELVAPLINAVKELYGIYLGHDEQLRKLASENEGLKQKNADLEERLNRLEKAINNK